MTEPRFHTLREIQSATDEVLALVVDVTDGWHANTAIVWEEVWDRLDNAELEDGSRLSIPELDNPAIRKIKRHVRDLRRQDGEQS